MTALTPAMISALTGAETAEVFVILLTIEHEDLPDPLRFSSDPTERHSTDPLVYKSVSGGEDFYFVPMDVVLPDDVEDSPPAAQLRISNVGRELIAFIRSVSTPASVTLALALASDLDETIALPTFDLVSVDYDAAAVTVKLAVDALGGEQFPAHAFDPAGFPALH